MERLRNDSWRKGGGISLCLQCFPSGAEMRKSPGGGVGEVRVIIHGGSYSEVPMLGAISSNTGLVALMEKVRI